MVRSLVEINERIKRGDAVVLTAQEVCESVERGEDVGDVDVVTCATRAIMSGTYAVLSFSVVESFVRAERVWMNGVPAYVGPCPNERLGVLDLIVFGTAHSKTDPGYGGGHLFRDLVEGKEIAVEVETNEGKSFTTNVTLEDIPHARLFATRHSFMNYSAFVNPHDLPVSTIFHATDFNTNLGGATFSGCGQLNPIKNDPRLETIGVGTRILLNGAEGFVIGAGTRSSLGKPNLAGFADMHRMDPQYMGGFMTAAGPECISAWAVPVPVVSQSILDSVTKLDGELPLPVMDVHARRPVCETVYGDVWGGVDNEVDFDPEICGGCTRCDVELACPMRAVHIESGVVNLDRDRCFNCGLCISICACGAFRGNLGAVRYNDGSQAVDVPVVLRQSDRARALRLAMDLKKRIIEGSFRINEMVERIAP